MKTLFTLSSIIILAGFNSLYSQSIDWTGLNQSSPDQFEGIINGFNMGGYSYGSISEKGSTVSIEDECIECLDFNCTTLTPEIVIGKGIVSMQASSAVIEGTAQIRPKLLRFPGGTHSGWYHYYQLDSAGFYDASNPIVAKGYGMKTGEVAHLPNPASYCQEDTKLLIDSNYIETFINYIKATENLAGNNLDIQVTYVVNLLAHFRFEPVTLGCLQTCGKSKVLNPMSNYDCNSSLDVSYVGNEALFSSDPDVYRFELYYKETQDAIEHIVDELGLTTSDTFFVELGNEYYDNVGLLSGYSNFKYQMEAQDYANLAENYSQRLKCYFQNKVHIKTAMVTKPNTSWQQTTNIFDVNFPGLSNMMSQDFDSNGATLDDVIDGVIWHDYYNANDCLDEDNIAARFDCAKFYLSEHINSSTKFENKINSLGNAFPNQEIWITEWSIVGGTAKRNVGYLNTILHAAYTMEYALKVIESNTNPTSNEISMLAHHRLGEKNKWSALQVETNESDTARIRTNAYPLMWLDKLNDYELNYHTGEVSMTGTFLNPEDGQFTAIEQSNHVDSLARILIYFTNKTDQNLPFQIPTIVKNGTVLNAELMFINGSSLFAYGPANSDAGKNSFANSLDTTYNEDLNSLGYGTIHDAIDSEGYSLSSGIADSIPPFSVGLLVLNFENSTAAINNSQDAQVKIYPNPSKDEIYFKTNNEVQTVYFYDSKGLLLKREKPVLNHVSIGDLSKGVYFLHIKVSTGETVVKRLIKL